MAHSVDKAELKTEADLDALSHPLRMRILGLLRSDGPSTASKLGARLGESSGKTSYHLRVLAGRGFVEDVPELGNNRDRWWRATAPFTSYDPSTFAGSPAASKKLGLLRTKALRWQRFIVERYLTEDAHWGAEWADAAAMDDALLYLTSDDLKRLRDEIWEVVERYAANPSAEDDAAKVVLTLNAVPVVDVGL